jgi:RNA-binding protein
MKQAHGLKPAVEIGRAGLDVSVVEQVRRVLESSELMKVRVRVDDRDEADAVARNLAQQCEAQLVGRIGKVAVIYRPCQEQQ